MGIRQLETPAAFRRPAEKRWDETDPVTGGFVAANAFVTGVNWSYSLDGQGTLLVNEDGAPPVRRRDCSDTDFDCNFWLGDAILVADDPTPDSDLLQAPIRLKFSPGVRAVGAWLGACSSDPFDQDFFDQPMFGAMWVALASDPAAWHLVRADGWSGHVCGVGTPLTAPFVGARATAGDRIIEARFDLSLLGNRGYDKIALSELTVEL
ncbi:hypothetical protein [Ottowia sp.]|uniref:hypothetical protein n=1 Tax=Ottowia sp. TaxID=1898956 RepID=UPI0039E599D5